MKHNNRKNTTEHQISIFVVSLKIFTNMNHELGLVYKSNEWKAEKSELA